eukprot:175575_1
MSSHRMPLLHENLTDHIVINDVAAETSEDGGSFSTATMGSTSYGTEKLNKGTMKKLNMMMGVFIPCGMSIFGVILFVRLPWIVGHAGLPLCMLMLALAYAVVTLTVLSLSAICSNGRMKGGGCYFLISRALGPEFGGAIGLIFFIANVFGVCVYLVGFSEALFSYFTTISATPVSLALSKSIPLVVLAVVCLVGAQAFAKTSLGIFVLMIISIFSCLLSTISQKSGQIDGYTGWSLETLNENVWSHFDEVDEHGKTYNFFTIFAIFFPAVTGIMAGANMSGDLKNPAKDIPGGTLRSLLFTG